MASTIDTTERLLKLGFTKAANKIKRLTERKRKLAIAYEHYRFVRPEKIQAFNEKLRKQSQGSSKFFGVTWKELVFTPIEHYIEIPPDDVLMALEEATNKKCFDSFEVAHILEVHDPIIFGRIEGCPDRFFIAQWDFDVKIEDILKDNEG